MALSSQDLERIGGAREVSIETRSGDRRIRTVIWVVVDNGDVLVRSVRGEGGRWYQRAVANPEVSLVVGSDRYRFRAIHAADPDDIERTSDALRHKYPPGRSLDSMVRPEVLGTTLLLESVS
ncbi:MAG: DUF2255 family protein [Acidimicrobiia bacterium]